MYTIDIYNRLQAASDGEKYLVLAELFKIVFGRQLRKSEWGFFRKLLNLYGDEVLFWAILASTPIEENQLAYISRVCANMLKEELNQPNSTGTLEKETTKKLVELRNLSRRLNEEN